MSFHNALLQPIYAIISMQHNSNIWKRIWIFYGQLQLSKLVTFIAHLSIRGYKHSTARSYSSAIAFQCKTMGCYGSKTFLHKHALYNLWRKKPKPDKGLAAPYYLEQCIANYAQFAFSMPWLVWGKLIRRWDCFSLPCLIKRRESGTRLGWFP